MNEMSQRFIALLEEDAAQAHEQAQHWKELERQGARLEDGDGNVIATAAEMVTKFTNREKEFRDLIDQVE
jgi:hypothetical protein